MLKELLSVFRQGDDGLAEANSGFLDMLRICEEMFTQAHAGIWDQPLDAGARSEMYRKDRRVNKTERHVRRLVLTWMNTGGAAGRLTHCVVLLHVVKDAERVGDYAKNLSEIREYHLEPLPNDDVSAELREIGGHIREILAGTIRCMDAQDEEDAVNLVVEARDLGKRCDKLLLRIANSQHSPATVTALVLVCRFYKRTSAHLANILSSLVMPVHKIDYFDEREIESAGS
ncbi:MAG: PhoU domain-containing protein [Myxococcota bacterium]|nr:PhoU domain-containing protein [Myxococcota bacterium]